MGYGRVEGKSSVTLFDLPWTFFGGLVVWNNVAVEVTFLS